MIFELVTLTNKKNNSIDVYEFVNSITFKFIIS